MDATRSADSRQYTVRTKNVARLRLSETAPGGAFQLDGQKFSAVPENPVFEKKNGKWTLQSPRSAAAGLRKAHGLQGPIDDAFTDSFLCVRPTGTPFHGETKAYAERMLSRLTADFAKWMRGDPRVKDDTAVTEADIANNNLILFGDPSSNRLIARVLAKLPVRWTRQEVAAGGHKYDGAGNLPVLIYPNPLNPKRYIVINSGHTFGEADFRGTNALLYPRLGDWAVVRTGDGEVLSSGFFNEWWQ